MFCENLISLHPIKLCEILQLSKIRSKVEQKLNNVQLCSTFVQLLEDCSTFVQLLENCSTFKRFVQLSTINLNIVDNLEHCSGRIYFRIGTSHDGSETPGPAPGGLSGSRRTRIFMVPTLGKLL